MNILPWESRFTYEITSKKEWIPEIEFRSHYEVEIINKFKEIEGSDELLLKNLRFFNKAVISVNVRAESYTVMYKGKEVVLSLSRLSRGERVIAMCLMADRTQSEIYLCYELSQLEEKTVEKLVSDYKDSKYINLVPPNEMTELILKEKFMKGD